MLVRLDAADRLVRALEERGSMPLPEAARLLFALSGGSEALGVGILEHVLAEDARVLRRGTDVVLAPAPFGNTPIEEACFAVIDVETNGLDGYARLTEIGIVVLARGRVDDEFGLLIHDENDRALARRALHRYCAEAVVAGHNLAFDLAFVDRELHLPGARTAAPTVDTLPLARRLLRGRIERATLSALAEFFGVDAVPCHRALPDARATAQVLLELIGLASDRGARTVGDLCGLARQTPRSQPERVSRRTQARAPEGPAGASRLRSIV